MKINAEQVKQLRETTGVSIMACKKALAEASGDLDKAKQILKKQGEKVADKKVARVTSQGLIECYVHSNGKIGAMVEVHCETDFVARNKDFKNLCKELALQIAGYAPTYVSPDYIPEEDLKKQKKMYEEDFSTQGLDKERLVKAVEAKLEKFKKENALLSQPYFRDEQKTIEDLIRQTIAKLGENIQVKRFTRYQI